MRAEYLPMDAVILPNRAQGDQAGAAADQGGAAPDQGGARPDQSGLWKPVDMVMCFIGFDDLDTSEWAAAALERKASVLFDVAHTDQDSPVCEMAEFVTTTLPDAVVIDWDWPLALRLIAELQSNPETKGVAIMILSDDGVSAGLNCPTVWEEPRPDGFPQVSELLHSYLDRTTMQRILGAARAGELAKRLAGNQQWSAPETPQLKANQPQSPVS